LRERADRLVEGEDAFEDKLDLLLKTFSYMSAQSSRPA
jgi:hypothetical protein